MRVIENFGEGSYFNSTLTNDAFIFRNRIAFYFFLFLAYFPWITPVRFGSDIQPYCMLFGAVLLVLSLGAISIPRSGILMLLSVAFSVLMHLLADGIFDIQMLRAVGAYASLLIVFLVSYNFYRHQQESARFATVVVLVYLVAGLIQLYIDPSFFSPILSRESGYGGVQGRGVEALAAEPTFFGIHLIFICLIALIPYAKNDSRKLIFLAVFALIFVSRSSTVLASLLFWLFLNPRILLPRESPVFRIIMAWGLVGLIVLVCLFIVNYMDVRFLYLLNIFLTNPEQLLIVDPSLNTRFFEIVISFYGFLESPLWGWGFHNFQNAIDLFVPKFDIPVNVYGDTGRITSFIGSIAFELGGIVLISLVPLFYQACNVYRYQRLDGKAVRVLLVILLLQGIPVSYPLVGIFLGRAIADVHRNQNL